MRTQHGFMKYFMNVLRSIRKILLTKNRHKASKYPKNTSKQLLNTPETHINSFYENCEIEFWTFLDNLYKNVVMGKGVEETTTNNNHYYTLKSDL